MRLIISLMWMFLVTTTSVVGQDTKPECPASQFTEWGANGIVTPGTSNRLRTEPSRTGAVIGQLAAGERFNVSYRKTACADGYLWVQVRTLYQEGWTAERAINGEPFIVPYVDPSPRKVGQLLEDGSYLIEERGLRVQIPASLNVKQALLSTRLGLFGDVMSAQPSSLNLTFENGSIQIFPYAITEAVREEYWGTHLETLLTDQPNLLEYSSVNRMPQAPIGGVRALFGGSGVYMPFNSGSGLRFLTYFAQNVVLFNANDKLIYLYRGITEDRAFLVTGELSGIPIPNGTIPSGGSRTSDSLYSAYLRQFEANLTALPTSAFTPDLSVIDTLFNSITITDNNRLMNSIP